jgi:hypothetical protein
VVVSSAALNPIPLKLVLSLATPAVVLEAVKKAVRPPCTEGVKLTSSEQEAPAPRPAVQFVSPIAKSLAALPTTCSASPFSANPPTFVTVIA